MILGGWLLIHEADDPTVQSKAFEQVGAFRFSHFASIFLYSIPAGRKAWEEAMAFHGAGW